LKSLRHIFTIILLTAAVLAQTSTPIRIVEQAAGWPVSNLVRHLKGRKILISADVRVIVKQPTKPAFVTVPFLSLITPEKVKLVSTTLEVRRIRGYYFQNNLYCVEASGTEIFHTNGIVTSRGGDRTILFFDDDGDGVFEQYEEGTGIEPFIPRLPPQSQGPHGGN
jgi:hypothetical protein